MSIRTIGQQLALCIFGLVIMSRVTSTASAVTVTFENPPYTPGNLIGQDGWVKNGYIGPGFDTNGTVSISATAPLSGAQSVLYSQTTSAAGTAATDVSKPEVISVNAGTAGVDLTVSYLLSASGNGVNPSGSAGLFLSNAAASGSSPLFARLEGASMLASDTNTIVAIPNFVYFAGDVLQVKYEVDFDASNYVLTVNNVSTNQLEFQQTLGYLAPFTPEGPNGEYLIDVGLLLRGGNAQIDEITLTPGVGPVIARLDWAGNKSGNWGTPQNWSPSGVPGSSPGRQTAVFGSAITSPQTIYSNADRAVNRLEFNNTNSYRISGTGSITMQADTSGGTPVNPTIAVTLGSHQLQLKVDVLDNTTVTVAPGAGLAFNNEVNLNGKTLTTSGAVSFNNSITGGGTLISSGSASAFSTVDIDGDFVSSGQLLLGFSESEVGSFNVSGDATLSGILDVLLLPGATIQQSMTIVSAGGDLDASGLKLDASDVALFKLTSTGNELVLNYIGGNVPEPTSCLLFALGTIGFLQFRKRSRSHAAGVAALVAVGLFSNLQNSHATAIDFENPPYTPGALVGQNGFVTPGYVLADPFFGGTVNGTVAVSNSTPLSGAQSALYNQTSVPPGAGASGASDVSKPLSVFGTRHGNDGFDINGSVLINMSSNSFGAGQAGVFLGLGGRSPALILLSGTQVLVGENFVLTNAGSYVQGHTFELSYGIDLDNGNYGVSTRDVTAGGPVTPLTGSLPSGRFPFFGGGLDADGDGMTYTLDMTMMLRSGTAKIDNFTAIGNDFVQGVWAGNVSGDWFTNINWIPRMVPGVETPGKQIAVFGSNITSPQTLYTNSTVSVNGLQFASPSRVAIGGGGLVELKASTSGGVINPTINVTAGNHELQAPVRIADNTSVSVAAGSTFDFNNSVNLNGKTLSIAGAGETSLNVGVTGGGTITNSGVLGTAGTTPIAANLTSTGKLLFDIGQRNTDFFNITGSATLSGILDVALEPSFTPAGSYTLLTASGGLSAAGLALDPSDTSMFQLGVVGNSLVLTVGSAAVNGDYNSNGVVDAADYVLWRNNVGTTNPLPNDNIGGTIGTAQYNLWRSRFGATSGAGSGSTAAVPEPGSICLALGCLALGTGMGRRRSTEVL